MIKLILTVVSLSFSGVFLTIFLQILRKKFSNQLSKQFYYRLYSLSIIRVLIPTYFGMNIFSLLSSQNDKSASLFPVKQKPFIILLVVIWGIVGAFILARQIWDYQSYKKYLLSNAATVNDQNKIDIFQKAKHNFKIKQNISLMYTDTTSPMIIGLFKPIIYIPYDCPYDDETLLIVLEHELLHYKRKDILVKWISTMAVTIHWFNPFIFRLKRQLELLCELSCDERILQNKTSNGRMSYGNTIINLVSSSSNQPKYAYHFSATAQTIKDRLYNISDVYKYNEFPKKLVYILCVLFLLVFIFLGSTPLSGIQKSNNATTGANSSSRYVATNGDNFQSVSVEGDIVNFNNIISIG